MDGSKTTAKSKKAANDAGHRHTRDLRSALDWLKARGDLVETDKPVDPDLEITGLPGGPFRGVFIRAPVIERVGRRITTLAGWRMAPSSLRGKATCWRVRFILS